VSNSNDDSKKILVWDAPVRVFHWLLVLSFVGAFFTAESDRWRLVHVSLGYTVGGLVAFRILWGLLGTRYARFDNFVRGPRGVAQYARAMLAGKPEHHVGHNPAGAVGIVLLLLLSLAAVASGWANDTELGGNLIEELHEVAGNLMLTVVFVHVAAVLVTSWMHRENLVRSMLTGKKPGSSEQAIQRPWRPLALIILVLVMGFWWLQWQGAPDAGARVDRATTSKHGNQGDRHRDDDHN
jgi:cytochrome b